MTIIRDRRSEPTNHKFGTDIERFRRRYMKQIRQAVHDNVSNGSLGDIGKQGISVPIPKESTHEPYLHHSGGGDLQRVFPGNVSLDVGDRIPRPQGGQGGGGKEGSDDPSTDEDSFVWVKPDEFLEILFEGRSLPDMTKLAADHVKLTERQHSGYTNKGPSHRMDMQRTNKKRKEDSLVLTKTTERRILANLSEQFNIFAEQTDPPTQAIELDGKGKKQRYQEMLRGANDVIGGIDVDQDHKPQDICDALTSSVQNLKEQSGDKITGDKSERLKALEQRLIEQFKGLGRVNTYQEEHLTYEYDDDVPVPSAKAVMFCQMDVSGSMGQVEKNTAKAFFWLMNQFLNTAYDEVDIVYISHTTTAQEVDEETFFYGKETGGTIVSSCIQKTLDIIEERYPADEWNIYSAQASDGDNWGSDNEKLYKKMEELIPLIQSHFYIEVEDPEYMSRPSDILALYSELEAKYEGKVRVQENLTSPKDALATFKKFFPAKGSTAPDINPSAGL